MLVADAELVSPSPGLMIWPFLLAVLAVVAVVWAMRISGRRGRRSSSAIAIAEERYARGEIGRDEFLRVRGDLGRE